MMNGAIRRAIVLPALLLSSTARAATPPPPLEYYGDLPAVEDMALSPSGNGLAILSRIRGERRILVVDEKKTVRIDVPVGDAKLRGMAWAGNDMVLVTNSATVSLGPMFTADKYELAGVMVLPIDGSKPQLVFGRTPSIGHTVFGNYGARLVNGRWMGYYGGVVLDLSVGGSDFVSGSPTLFQVDLASNSPRRLAAPSADAIVATG